MQNKKTISRKIRVRKKLVQVSDRPRLQVHRSNKYTYAQIIGESGTIVAAVSESLLKGETGSKTDRAEKLGELLAKLALKKGVTTVVFDRGQYTFHGRIKALAESARKAGLQF